MIDTQRCVGISLSSSKLQFVEIEKESEALKILNFGQTFFIPQIDFNKQVESNILDQLQSAYDEIKNIHPTTTDRISFSLPPELFITIQLPYDPNLNQNEIRDEFKWELSELFPYILIDDMALKFYELDNTFLDGKHNALIVALDKKYLLLIKKFCQNNSLVPKLVDNSSIAANTFINNNHFQTRYPVCVNIFNSKKMITLFINISSKPAFVKAIKKQEIGYIKNLLDVFSNIKMKNAVTRESINAIISGDELETENIAELGTMIPTKFNVYNPFGAMKFEDVSGNISVVENDKSSFTSAIGIASRFS